MYEVFIFLRKQFLLTHVWSFFSMLWFFIGWKCVDGQISIYVVSVQSSLLTNAVVSEINFTLRTWRMACDRAYCKTNGCELTWRVMPLGFSAMVSSTVVVRRVKLSILSIFSDPESVHIWHTLPRDGCYCGLRYKIFLVQPADVSARRSTSAPLK